MVIGREITSGSRLRIDSGATTPPSLPPLFFVLVSVPVINTPRTTIRDKRAISFFFFLSFVLFLLIFSKHKPGPQVPRQV